MNILSINNYAYPRGGSEQYFFNINKVMELNGHIVTPFAIKDECNIYPDDDFPVGLDLEKPSVFDIFHFFYSFNARNKLIDIISKNKFDVAHLHIYHGQLSASILAPLRDAGIPIVQTLHDFKSVCSNSILMANDEFCDNCAGRYHWRAIIKRCNRGSLLRSAIYATEAYFSNWLGAVKYVDQFITVSDYQKNQLIRLGLPENKLTTIYHYEIPDERDVGENNYFLFVGRLVREKGVYDLIEAYRKLGCNAPTLKIVGDGPELLSLVNILSKESLNVEILGWQSGDFLKNLYRNAICLINPSHYFESFGLTLIEAYACSKPVIATRKGGMVEVVVEGESGLLFESGSTDQLSICMQFFIDNPMIGIEMGNNGRKLLTEKFNLDKHFFELIKVFNKASGGW